VEEKNVQDLNGKVCVVTGAGHGVGEALAHALAARGARLVLADVDETALKDTGEQVARTGAPLLLQRTDVSQPDDVDALARAAIDRFGAVHLLINNAGVGALGLVWSGKLEDWTRTFAVNVMGVVHGLRSFVPLLLAQSEPSHVVNVCSLMGLTTAPVHGAYGASKHAVLAITETLRDELAMSGKTIGVSVVCPGPIRTNMINTAHGEPGTPEAATIEMLKALFKEKGMEASEVARHIVEGVLANRFWIFPAPEFFDPSYPRVAQIREALGIA
jgi:NAD(P)-dependent dehydrogenase (short-subunit alcohol dehydrogenase family)